MRRIIQLATVVVAISACGGLAQSPSSSAPTASPGLLPPASASPAPTAGEFASIPRCDEVPWISAPASAYRDSPISVGNEQPTDELRTWAIRQPGFVDLWIDRDHNGWVTLAFREGAADRQVELEAEFPGVGVVAVDVPTSSQELRQIQSDVIERLRNVPGFVSSGQYPNKGVVSIGFDYLEDHKIAIAEERFAGRAVCLEGQDPSQKPEEGPQPQSGDGWRLLADQDETGDSYRTGIAYDETSYEELWSYVQLDGIPPPVDFETEVVIWFGEVHGSSCPRLRLNDVVVDLERSLVHADITRFEAGACTADPIPRVEPFFGRDDEIVRLMVGG